MLYHRVSPKNSLGAALRSLQDARTRFTPRASNTVRVSRTTRGVTLQVKRRVADESTAVAREARYI